MDRNRKQFDLCFLHGLDSSPAGTKARLIRKRYSHCRIPTLPPDIHERLRIVANDITTPHIVVGSSLGGLTALMFADRFPQRVRAMLLMAPAVGCTDPTLFTPEQEKALQKICVPAGIPTVIVAGRQDELIPLGAIEALVQRSPAQKNIRLIAVNDDHNLHASLDLMMQLLAEMIDRIP